ncbi:hypothetical protein LSS_06649 [Leptospira santarosai serovar Shermani str. LT 821]|uniref:Uncharacterized protein n=1 Tax=Leptospira santarosai serovar Shermani str. LT 821 TaxID=758847 RepID=K8Y213_9LEPT|nr:hypothetical protein LSS_06649 [Leptospira santarosai serovar Shermani str. LT 821]EMM76154.1 hypothetical protein LEP1GSC040_3939 [Leptospira santarosai str. 2000030832]
MFTVGPNFPFLFFIPYFFRETDIDTTPVRSRLSIKIVFEFPNRTCPQTSDMRTPTRT